MRQRDDLGPTAWTCHLHPSLRFSGSSNHLIHAFLAAASLVNLCPPKLLHLGTQHSVPCLCLLRLSMPPTATHQQDNSYGGSAIWRVSNRSVKAFLAVASLGNLCPPKLLHLGTQHSVPRLCLLQLSMPPTATHQQDNSYDGSAIWRVSKFVIPLI